MEAPLVPGVAGGVNAGEIRAAGKAGVEEPSSCQWETFRAAGHGCGERIGEAWEGRSGILHLCHGDFDIKHPGTPGGSRKWPAGVEFER